MSKRWRLWLPLLAIAAWLALFGDSSPSVSAPVAERAAPPRTAVTRTASAPAENLLKLIPRDELVSKAPAAGEAAASGGRDLFSTRHWNPPAPPAPVVVATPVAPPLPFSFLGKKLEGGAWEVYLGRGDQTFIVHEAQVLDGVYRVDKIEPPSLSLTYLPLGQLQTLSIGDTR